MEPPQLDASPDVEENEQRLSKIKEAHVRRGKPGQRGANRL
jgi:hypothetical protein